jgi:pimeloyl-ACP methyl ester carboxylesterase
LGTLQRRDAPVSHLCHLSRGRRIEYLKIGHGERELVFLHGFGASPLLLLRVIRVMASWLGLTVYAFYLPNHGRSSDTTRFDPAVDMLAEAARFLGLAGLWWVGHSIGGFMAAAMRVRHPELVANALAIDPPWGGRHDVRPLRWTYALPRLTYLYVEALVLVMFTALPSSLLSGHGRDFALAQRDLALHPPRLSKAFQVLLDAPCLKEELNSPEHRDHVYAIFHRRDWVVGAPMDYVPHVYILPCGVHNFVVSGGTRCLRMTLPVIAEILGVPPISTVSTRRRPLWLRTH